MRKLVLYSGIDKSPKVVLAHQVPLTMKLCGKAFLPCRFGDAGDGGDGAD